VVAPAHWSGAGPVSAGPDDAAGAGGCRRWSASRRSDPTAPNRRRIRAGVGGAAQAPRDATRRRRYVDRHPRRGATRRHRWARESGARRRQRARAARIRTTPVGAAASRRGPAAGASGICGAWTHARKSSRRRGGPLRGLWTAAADRRGVDGGEVPPVVGGSVWLAREERRGLAAHDVRAQATAGGATTTPTLPGPR